MEGLRCKETISVQFEIWIWKKESESLLRNLVAYRMLKYYQHWITVYPLMKSILKTVFSYLQSIGEFKEISETEFIDFKEKYIKISWLGNIKETYLLWVLQYLLNILLRTFV